MQSDDTHGEQASHRMRLRTVALSVPATVVLWFLLTGVTPHEVAVGAFTTLLTTTIVFAMHRCYPQDVRFPFRAALALWQVPVAVVKDTATVTRALLRDLSGVEPMPSLFRTVRWEQRSDTAVRQGRGVLATVAMTASPNAIVLGIDPEQSRMVFHQIHREPMSTMAKQLGAQP